MPSRNTSNKPNGHAGTPGRPNGHAPASTERGGILVRRDQAASDDDRRAPVTGAAGSGTAPGTDCEAYAEAAPPPPEKESASTKRGSQRNDKPKDPEESAAKKSLLAGPTDFAAIEDGAAYVDSVASRVDLVGASVLLVSSEDEKIAKAELDRLRDMKFGKAGAIVADEPLRLDFGDMPRPVRQ
jgi:hypothetical protein